MSRVCCDRCGLAVLGTERIAIWRDGQPVGEVDLCPRCVDQLLENLPRQPLLRLVPR